jgi:molybdopterin-guanine dinucleotide biosynthesis protein
MPLVVVGGHTRNIGKTTLAAQIIAAFANHAWTAMKITQYGHNVCSANGEACDCATADHSIAISEERNATSGTDTARMLAAGAHRVLWVRTRQGELAEAIPRIRKEIDSTDNVLIESNSILRFIKPDIYVAVLDPAVADFKASASRYLDRADAIFTPDGAALTAPAWSGIAPALYARKPVFALHESALIPNAENWFRDLLNDSSIVCRRDEASALR